MQLTCSRQECDGVNGACSESGTPAAYFVKLTARNTDRLLSLKLVAQVTRKRVDILALSIERDPDRASAFIADQDSIHEAEGRPIQRLSDAGDVGCAQMRLTRSILINKLLKQVRSGRRRSGDRKIRRAGRTRASVRWRSAARQCSIVIIYSAHLFNSTFGS